MRCNRKSQDHSNCGVSSNLSYQMSARRMSLHRIISTLLVDPYFGPNECVICQCGSDYLSRAHRQICNGHRSFGETNGPTTGHLAAATWAEKILVPPSAIERNPKCNRCLGSSLCSTSLRFFFLNFPFPILLFLSDIFRRACFLLIDLIRFDWNIQLDKFVHNK